MLVSGIAWTERRWEPLLLVGRGPDAMQALLALAVGSDECLVVCGANQAEYQCWLATAQDSASFVGAALERLLADVS